MFLKTSRYFGLETVQATDRSGRAVSAVKIRPLPNTVGDPATVTGSDRLDITAERLYRDATRFWHIADANAELDANALMRAPGRTIYVPKS